MAAVSVTCEYDCESSHHTFRLNTAAGTMTCALAATRENSRPMSGSFMPIAGPLSAYIIRKVRTERPAEPDRTEHFAHKHLSDCVLSPTMQNRGHSGSELGRSAPVRHVTQFDCASIMQRPFCDLEHSAYIHLARVPATCSSMH